VSANFVLDDVTLFVTRNGNGTITSNPAGINCPGDCNQTYTANQMVTLTATAGTGSTFTGWTGGGCTGTGTCTVTMTAATTVTATFTLNLVTIMVTKSGGSGTVTATGIACGGDCMETVNYGTTLTLTATPSTSPATASTFTGWTSGGCSGTGACTLTLTTNTTVNAGFKLRPNIIFVTSTMSDGNLGGLDGADRTCMERADAASIRGNFVAYLSSTGAGGPIHAPSRVGTATGWVRVDGRPVMESVTQMHLGTLMFPPQLTETGADVAPTDFPYVWTGTSTAGTFTRACSPASVFVPWGGNTSGTTIGQSTLTTSGVVEVATVNCTTPRRLYCLGIDRRATAQ
jgi:hypothetical protein